MQLILWRHAEAADDAPTDLARELTLRGKKQASKMSAWLANQLGGDLTGWTIISSPAMRTRQTAATLAQNFDIVDAIAPDCPPDAVLKAAKWPGNAANVIVVGHQPTLGMVAAKLINGVDGYVAVKKGAMWWFESRDRDGERQTVLKAMASPDTVP